MPTSPSVAPNSLLSPNVPLARDDEGRPVHIPEAAVGWRVRRHTGGRPRLHLDAAKQPMQLSLAYSHADLDDILPPGSYYLDLVDADGKMLATTVKIAIGLTRNAESPGLDDEERDDEDIHDHRLERLRSHPSDTRFVLEANVRSTQLAFQHNERTLAAGLRMADTLREGIQTLAETQGELVKSLVAARGFPRNGWVQQPAPTALAVVPPREDDDDEDEEDAPPPSGSERLVEFGIGVVEMVNKLLANFGSPQGATNKPKAAGGGFKLPGVAELLDWRKAMPANEKNGEAAQRSELPPAASVEEADAMPPLDPKTMAHFIAIQAALKPDEAAMARAIAGELAPAELRAWFEELRTLSIQDAVAKIRTLIGKGAAS